MLQRQIEENIAHGLTLEQAQAAACRALSGLEQRKEECRDMRKVRLMEDLMKDTRYAVRMLRRSPGFSILAILCLTLGIGATTAVFSWVEGILLRPFPAGCSARAAGGNHWPGSHAAGPTYRGRISSICERIARWFRPLSPTGSSELPSVSAPGPSTQRAASFRPTIFRL